MNELPKRKCKECIYYPQHCGSWMKRFRQDNPTAFKSDKVHNCHDYKGAAV